MGRERHRRLHGMHASVLSTSSSLHRHLTHPAARTRKQDLSATEGDPVTEMGVALSAPVETPVPHRAELRRSWSLELGNHNIDKVRPQTRLRSVRLERVRAPYRIAEIARTLPSDHGHEVSGQSDRAPRSYWQATGHQPEQVQSSADDRVSACNAGGVFGDAGFVVDLRNKRVIGVAFGRSHFLGVSLRIV